jgi:diketogulonate reductase-like aldo/keto reductase
MFLVACNAQTNKIKKGDGTMKNKVMPVIELNNGVKMPQFGIGTYMIAEGDEAYNTVLTALKEGYRHIDTAHAYQNERSVGKAIKDSKIPREEIWVTSKLWINEYGEGKTLKAIDRMLNRLGLDYVDLVYFHQPVGDYVAGWKEMEKALESGKVRAIGISNFDVSDEIFDNFISTVKIKPQVMQIECHPYAQRKHWQDKLKEHNIKLESWFPLGGRESKGEILRDSVLNEIGKAHGKTAAQVIIRWHIQEGFFVIPGTSNPDYIKENIDVFDFELSDEEMDKIHKLNKEKRYFNMPYEQQVKWFSQYNPQD